MNPWLADPDVRLFHGDALDVLRELPSGSVHMCATSPPFWNLRDYNAPGQIGLDESYLEIAAKRLQQLSLLASPTSGDM